MPKPRKYIIHKYALRSGAIVVAMPSIFVIPSLVVDALAMSAEIKEAFGIDNEKAAAPEIIATCGSAISEFALFKTAEYVHPYTIPVKIAIAFVVIEIAGNLIFHYFKKKHNFLCDARKNPE